jgi:hypothetical protein
MVFIYHSFSWFPFHEKMWNSINHYFMRSTVFKPWFSMVYKPCKRRISPSHDKMWLQNHEKMTRGILKSWKNEVCKPWFFMEMINKKLRSADYNWPVPTQKKMHRSKPEYPLFTGKLWPSPWKFNFTHWLKWVKITLSKDENHEKTWFLEGVNKKTMKKHGFCEPHFFKIALTVVLGSTCC